MSEDIQAIWDLLELKSDNQGFYNILIPLSCMLCLIYMIYIKKYKTPQKITIKSFQYGILFAVTTSAILVLTLLDREYNQTAGNWELRLGWSYQAAFISGEPDIKRQIIHNILLFLPWGFSMPLVFKKYRSFYSLLLLTMFFSGMIEFTQGIFSLGLFEWDDIISNTIGAAAGWCFYKTLIHLTGFTKNLFITYKIYKDNRKSK